MSKDKIYGFVIALLFLLVLLVYTLAVFLPGLGNVMGQNLNVLNVDLNLIAFLTMLPVYGGVALFSFIFIWIGWTMATTPPPEPIDLDSLDLDDDEEEESSS